MKHSPIGGGLVNRYKVRCKRGHLFTKVNTYRFINKRGITERHCRLCQSFRWRRARDAQNGERVRLLLSEARP